MKAKIKFVKEYECEQLKKQDIITVTYYDDNGIKRWFWCYKNQLHQIAFCPYCGADLNKEVSNE